MDKEQMLYGITIKDVINVSKETGIDFTENDIEFIQDKIGDFMGNTWRDAVEFALDELETRKPA